MPNRSFEEPFALPLAVLLMLAFSASATQCLHTASAEFRRTAACAATGKARGACPPILVRIVAIHDHLP